MDPIANRNDAKSAVIDDLFSLTLVDGLRLKSGATEVIYRQVRLRETNVNDERFAVRQAERVMMVGSQAKLLVSESEFRLAMTLRHIDKLSCDALSLDGALLDLDILGKLSTHDVQLLEQRVLLITLAAQVRYGMLAQDEFDAIATGRKPHEGMSSPQPMGQAAEHRADGAQAESGPWMLADFARSGSGGSSVGNGR